MRASIREECVDGIGLEDCWMWKKKERAGVPARNDKGR